jgi:hypothetical protein
MKNFQSGRYIQQGYYKSFQPNPIDRVWSMDNMELIQLLGRADREMGRLDMYSDYIPNIDLFIRRRGYANANLDTLPFSSRLIRETHRTLLQGVRGKHKQPSEFRQSQNWTGGAVADSVVSGG